MKKRREDEKSGRFFLFVSVACPDREGPGKEE
jgi:hypothetical protein